jgi:predicted aspartyl protease
MKCWVFATVAVIVSTAHTPGLGQTAVRLQVAGDLVLAPVNVDGRSFDFLIDTGSAGSAIDLETARKLGLTPISKERVEKNFRELVADVVEIPAFRIGNSTFSNVKFYELNLAPQAAIGAQVDGVLGNDVLEGLVFRLNYSKQRLFFESLHSLRSRGTVVPLRRSNGQFLISTTLVSEPIDLILDTGTNVTSLSWRSWEKVTRTWKPAGIVAGIARAGNPTSPAILVCLPEIRFGGEVVRDHAVRAQTKSDEGVFDPPAVPLELRESSSTRTALSGNTTNSRITMQA